jgi:hypothetical protein
MKATHDEWVGLKELERQHGSVVIFLACYKFLTCRSRGFEGINFPITVFLKEANQWIEAAIHQWDHDPLDDVDELDVGWRQLESGALQILCQKYGYPTDVQSVAMVWALWAVETILLQASAPGEFEEQRAKARVLVEDFLKSNLFPSPHSIRLEHSAGQVSRVSRGNQGSTRKKFSLICEKAKLIADGSELTWKELALTCEASECSKVVQAFQDYVDLLGEQKMNNPIAAFLVVWTKKLPTTSSSSKVPKEALNKLAVAMYTVSGPQFTGNNLQALADLLQEFTEEEIVTAWATYVRDHGDSNPDFWTKGFAEGGGRTTAAWVRKEAARLKEMLANSEAQIERDRAKIAEELARIPKTEEEFTEELKRGA